MLAILSKTTQDLETTLKNVVCIAYRLGIKFYFNENRPEWLEVGLMLDLKESQSTEYFLMDIKSIEDQLEDEQSFKDGILDANYKNQFYYYLAATDNTPSELCYRFSLAYLRLCPEHIISMYDDYYITIEYMENLEKNEGFHEGWIVNADRG